MHEMRTDPANFDYICVSGCRRDVRSWDMEENGQVTIEMTLLFFNFMLFR